VVDAVKWTVAVQRSIQPPCGCVRRWCCQTMLHSHLSLSQSLTSCTGASTQAQRPTVTMDNDSRPPWDPMAHHRPTSCRSAPPWAQLHVEPARLPVGAMAFFAAFFSCSLKHGLAFYLGTKLLLLQSDSTAVFVCGQISRQCLISLAAVGSSCRRFLLQSDSTVIEFFFSCRQIPLQPLPSFRISLPLLSKFCEYC
jgi:hypothetical protein